MWHIEAILAQLISIPKYDVQMLDGNAMPLPICVTRVQYLVWSDISTPYQPFYRIPYIILFFKNLFIAPVISHKALCLETLVGTLPVLVAFIHMTQSLIPIWIPWWSYELPYLCANCSSTLLYLWLATTFVSLLLHPPMPNCPSTTDVRCYHLTQKHNILCSNPSTQTT